MFQINSICCWFVSYPYIYILDNLLSFFIESEKEHKNKKNKRSIKITIKGIGSCNYGGSSQHGKMAYSIILCSRLEAWEYRGRVTSAYPGVQRQNKDVLVPEEIEWVLPSLCFIQAFNFSDCWESSVYQIAMFLSLAWPSPKSLWQKKIDSTSRLKISPSVSLSVSLQFNYIQQIFFETYFF